MSNTIDVLVAVLLALTISTGCNPKKSAEAPLQLHGDWSGQATLQSSTCSDAAAEMTIPFSVDQSGRAVTMTLNFDPEDPTAIAVMVGDVAGRGDLSLSGSKDWYSDCEMTTTSKLIALAEDDANILGDLTLTYVFKDPAACEQSQPQCVLRYRFDAGR